MTRLFSFRRIGALLLGVVLASSVQAADKLKVAAIYPSPVGDVGWAFELDRGLKAIEAAFPGKVETSYVENVSEGPDAARIMNQMAARGAKMIILGSFGYMNDGLKLAKRRPDIKFIHASGYQVAKNFGNFQTRNYESAYLMGMASGYVTQSNTLGVVAAYAIPEVVGIINAFTMGAQSTNPEVNVKVVWLNAWFNPTKAQESARSLIAQQADVIFSLYQDTPSVVTVGEQEGVFVINTSSDMKKYAPNHLLGSMTISWGKYFVAQTQAVLNGNFKGSPFWGGVKDGAVGIGSLSDKLSSDQRAAIMATMADIGSGSFHPFNGPVIDQNGKERVAGGSAISDSDLLGINWLVRGVQTRIPN
ncbi:MAG: BMP family ABC transporter substrate-binding protein [Gammaproteobacteria bacterium]|nr:BMP family ABC transporter substrate-binding protein [Gammaproteobacteria bacterium]